MKLSGSIAPFDVIINHGTAEHIFNIAQVLMTMHDLCADGGLMVHDAPFTGWIDHGFYCLQPTLFYDLAAANCYEIVRVAIHEIQSQTIIPLEGRDHVASLAAAGKLPNNAMLFVALRKLTDRPFKIPTQGVYAGALSAAGKQAWENLR
jgi:ureidoglycolate hydrolase